jgi:putative hydrolase
MQSTYPISPNIVPMTDVLRADAQISVCRCTLAEAVAHAEQTGLRELTLVGRVCGETRWVPAFFAMVRELRRQTRVQLHAAVEARLLDMSGRLDLPADLTGADAIYVADDQVPMPNRPSQPGEIRGMIEAGELNPRVAIVALVIATALALQRPEPMVIARLFHVLPSMGLSEDDVPRELIEGLAAAASAAGARLEIDDRAPYPQRETLRPFVERGVPLLFSMNSHRFETLGQYDPPPTGRLLAAQS